LNKNFQQYIDLYIGDKSAAPRVYEDAGERWEYAVALTPTNEFIQISFVNGIHTAKGGKHVEYILNQITRKLVEFIEKKKKVKVNPNSIKEQIMLFIRCDIENPAFDSQTKDFMNTPSSKFGTTGFVYEDNGECSLASNKQIIPGVLISGLQLEQQGDLYGGFIINGDLTKLYCFARDDDEEEDEDSVSLHSIRIFRYGDVFFSYDTDLNIIELEARPPISGNRTKAALSGDSS
jgi:hypothetical protein